MSILSSHSDDAGFVDACFRTFLGRPADEQGLAFHLRQIEKGASRLALIDLFLESEEYRARNRANQWVQAGHFYSPLPSVADVAEHAKKTKMPTELPGIDLQELEQLALLEAFRPLYPTIPFQDKPVDGLRYGYVNSSFPHGDAIMLHCMLRQLKPARLIEVGCGNSSCVTLDTVERFLGNAVDLTFIEPYPAFFRSVLPANDIERVRLVEARLQDVPLATFTQLQARDILFIDSTHVAKLDSDVNHFLFEIFPRLNPGVFIHIHDVFYPFEYPQSWLEEGRGWNEQYALRAFLMFNPAFRIRLFNTYLYWKYRPWFELHMPACLRGPGGSLWIEKVA